MSLWIWLGIAAILALIYGAAYSWRDTTGGLRSAVKTASVLLLAGAGTMCDAPALIVLGLVLGALGDLCLSRPGTSAFLAGMAAFAAGHLAYAFYFWGMPGSFGLWGPLALLLLAATTEAWLAPRTGALRWPVRGYVVVITLMGLAALRVDVGLILTGAALFILSDVLLALHLFVFPKAKLRPLMAMALWPCYWGGQVLILLGALGAVSLA
ncbi:lysoplasmalogenase [Pseudorhodobacter sp.]|uniref:lysoplasmalogenase n=1 Tax=Pseudorhodobacter sp. TaxID=1934400 RepID=UPI00264771FC|nr:lysoplasmalogenase [Pseudorhodobacter sp.]MDN5787206.1 lysoplasmalogenase [Pseudorhodobacter sp.]